MPSCCAFMGKPSLPLAGTRWVLPLLCGVGAQRPGGLPARQGSPFLPRNGEKEGRGKPLDPRFLWPLVPTRWFLGLLALVRSRGYFVRYAKTDLGRIFEGKYAGKNFPERKFPKQAHPQSLPLGEGGPAKPGRMRGRSIGPTGREKEVVEATGPSFYKERFGTRTPHHPSRGQLPPMGKPPKVPYTKKRPKSGHVHGHRNSLSTGTMWYPTPKRASGNERALKWGGRGPPPRDFASGLSLEKA